MAMQALFWFRGPGHAALQTGSKYLSFHPLDYDGRLADKARLVEGERYRPCFTSYADDLSHYGQPAHALSVHHSVNEAEVSSAIGDIKSNPPPYRLYGPNCSTEVVSALHCGVHEDALDGFISSIRHAAAHLVPHRITEIEDIAEHVGRNLTHFAPMARGGGKAAVGVAAVAFMARKFIITDPEGAYNYVEALNHHHHSLI